jgi:hypothetical protein
MKHSSSSGNSSSITPMTGGPLTPLSTLSTILTTHAAHSHTALQLFRQAHAMHRHASERTYLAMEKLRAAQAEVEHATTAQEFAKEELDKAAMQKTDAHDAMVAMGKRIRILSKGLKNERVRLVGLTQNVHWNGRLGTILKIITDGEDAGRWKIKLDHEWRGRDADGKIVHRSDETNSDGSGGGGGSVEDGDDEHPEGTAINMVVAKAENLELIDEGDVDLFHNPQQQQVLPTTTSSSSSRSRSGSSKRRGASQLLTKEEKEEEDQKNSRMNYHSPDRRSRDPSISRRHDPTAATAATAGAGAVVTPEHSRSPRKQIVPADYVKSEDGRYRETLPTHTANTSLQRRQQHQHQHQHQQKQQQPIKPSMEHLQQPILNHPAKQVINEPPPRSSSTSRNYPPRNSSASHNSASASAAAPAAAARSTAKYNTISPIRRSPSNDSTRLSSAFSQMLLSPVSFTPVSFHPESSESFERWVRQEDKEADGAATNHTNRDNNNDRMQQQQLPQPHGVQQQQQQKQQQQQQQHQQGPKQMIQHNNSSVSGDSFWCAGSYFDEVTSLDKDAFPYNEGKKSSSSRSGSGNHNGKYYEWDDTIASDPKLQCIPPSPDETYSAPNANDEQHGHHGLPHIMVLPAPEDEYDDVFAPDSSPPYCVGVQHAGYSHVNGVYLLAHSNKSEMEDGGDTKTAPLYFKDGPPTLLSDNRYYDMCILRINCPDSADHVIWFLARVDIDPACLDVKFSDCYYYCRMLRNDDGCGGEREGGCDSPPSSGWHLPKLPPGVDSMLSIAKSGSFSTVETGPSNYGDGGYGLGIASRPAMMSSKQRAQQQQQQQHHEDGKRTIQQQTTSNSRFVSLDNPSAMGSKYSI